LLSSCFAVAHGDGDDEGSCSFLVMARKKVRRTVREKVLGSGPGFFFKNSSVHG